MKAYLINLNRSPDRLAEMRTAFERAGAAFERVEAVDAQHLSETERADFTEKRTKSAPGGWLPGEIGIFLSHLKTWKLIASSPGKAAAIFEDDVLLAKDLGPLLSSDDWLPENADLIRLESNRRLLLRHGRKIAATAGRRIYEVASGTWGAAGYIVTRDAAARLAESDPDLHSPADIFLFKPDRSVMASAMRTFQIVPALCIQKQLVAGSDKALPSLVGTTGRTPPPYRDRWLNITRFIPGKKQHVPFKA